MGASRAKPSRWWPGFRADHPIARGCRGHWPFVEGQAEKAYDVVRSFDLGYHGILTNMNPATKWASGPTIDFDGLDDFVEIGDQPELVMTTSVSVVVRFNERASGNFTGLVSNWSASAGDRTQYVMTVEAGSSNQIRFFIGDGAGFQFADGPTINTGQWYHAVGTYDKADGFIRLYLDGALVDTTACSRTMSGSGNSFRIGQTNDGAPAANINWNGLIDYVSVYDRALTAAEALELAYDRYALTTPRLRTYHYAVTPSVGNRRRRLLLAG